MKSQLEYDESSSYHHESEPMALMFRPDALVRERSTGDLYIVSWKTCATFGQMTLRQCRTDMQSMSEVWGREQGDAVEAANADQWGKQMRIEGVLYKFCCKGKRTKDDWDGLYKQDSPLIYGWHKLGTSGEEAEWSWAYRWSDPAEINIKTGKAVGHTLGKGWQKKPIWRDYPGGVRAWIEGLAKQEIFPRYANALVAAFPSALPVSRRADEIERWKRQIVGQELRVNDDLVRIEAGAVSDDDKAAMLDTYFPQHTSRCEDYSGCPMFDVCWTPAVAMDPIGSGLYQIRTNPNHPEGGNDGE